MRALVRAADCMGEVEIQLVRGLWPQELVVRRPVTPGVDGPALPPGAISGIPCRERTFRLEWWPAAASWAAWAEPGRGVPVYVQRGQRFVLLREG